MMLHLHFVRHGQTYFNIYNKMQGWSNSPLTEAGIADAEKAGEKFKNTYFPAVYCSDTTRAHKTALKIIEMNEAEQGKPELIMTSFFREQFYGYYEGLDAEMTWSAAGGPHGARTYKEIIEKFGHWATRDFMKEADPFHDAESNEEYWDRIFKGYDLISSNPNLKDGDHVLIIAHGNSLLSLMYRFGPSDFDLSERPSTGSETCVEFDTSKPKYEGIKIVSFNDDCSSKSFEAEAREKAETKA